MTSGAEVVSGMSMREYLSLKRLSSGLCHRILSESPLHARLDSPWNESRSQDNSNVADIGSAAHKMVLEGTEDGIAVIQADDWRTKIAKEGRDAAYAAGHIPMLEPKMNAVRSMVTAAREFIASSEIPWILEGETEVTLLFNIEEIECKARCDKLTTQGTAVNLSYKTTAGSANPDSWIRTQLPQYDVASVFYERAVFAACGVAARTIHLIQEQKYPYACSLVGLAPAYRALAEMRLEQAIAVWEQCVGTGRWPAYPSRVAWAEPKAWQQMEAEEQQNDDSAFFSNEVLAGGIPL